MPYVLMCFNAKEDPQYTQVLKTIYPEKVPIREELHKHVFGESLDPKVHEWLKGANHDPYSIVAHDGTVYWWAEYLGEANQALADGLSTMSRPGVYIWDRMPLLEPEVELAELDIPTLTEVLVNGRPSPQEDEFLRAWNRRLPADHPDALRTPEEWRRPTHAGMGAGMYQIDGVSKLFWQLLWALLAFLLVAVVVIQIGIAAGWFPRGNR